MTELVYVTASWCVPCKRFRPLVEAHAAGKGVLVRFVDVDTDTAEAIALGIKSVPTLIVYRDNEEIDRTGVVSASRLADLLA